MKIRMKVQISGTRNGQTWPPYNEVLEVGDEEGAELCAAGMAVPVADDGVETAVAPDAEKRGLTTADVPTKTTRRKAS